jgi:hypothetical protein
MLFRAGFFGAGAGGGAAADLAPSLDLPPAADFTGTTALTGVVARTDELALSDAGALTGALAGLGFDGAVVLAFVGAFVFVTAFVFATAIALMRAALAGTTRFASGAVGLPVLAPLRARTAAFAFLGGLLASVRGECAFTSSSAMIHAETWPATSPCERQSLVFAAPRVRTPLQDGFVAGRPPGRRAVWRA